MASLADSKPIFILAALFSIAMVLQLLGCVLWNNWWPMLVLIVYLVVPVPFLICGGDSRSGNESFQDAGKFLSGFAAISSIAIPSILYHASIITLGSLMLELSAALVLGGTCITYDYLASKHSGGADFGYY
jgi:hypothetical protein